MTTFIDTIRESQLGYAAIFICIGTGFLFLRTVDREDIGTGYMALSFFLNSIGFLFWAGIIPIEQLRYFLIGEIFHIAGFIVLVCGVYRFMGYRYRLWNLVALLAWLTVWACAIIFRHHQMLVFMLMMKALRGALFTFAGVALLKHVSGTRLRGKNLAGWSLSRGDFTWSSSPSYKWTP